MDATTRDGAGDYGRLSQWRDTTRVSAEQAKELTSRLEQRAKAQDEIAARDEYLRLLSLTPGERVLDIGCGSGVVTRAIASKVVPGGRVLGIDSSSEFLAVARKEAESAGISAAVEFREGDCRRLPLEDAAFDAVLAATVFAHVPGVEAAIDEMIRVTKRGGRVGIFDFDGDCFVVSHPDRELTRRIVAAFSDHSAVNSHLVRRLPGILSERGIVDVQARGLMSLERGAGFYSNMAERAAQLAAKVGAVTTVEADAWMNDLHEQLRNNTFMGGRLHIFVWGRRS